MAFNYTNPFAAEQQYIRQQSNATPYQNPYAQAAGAQNAYSPAQYSNPYAQAAAMQDPLAQRIAGGSSGMGGFNDTVTPTGVNTNAASTMYGEGGQKTVGGQPIPPPPPPPPPPPQTMAAYRGYYDAASLQNQPRALPQGSLTADQYAQVLRMNNMPTGNAYDPNAGFAMQQAQGTGVRPDMAAFNDLMTPTGRSTEMPTYGPRDMTNAVAPMRTPYTDPGAGMAEAQNPSVTRQLPQGGLTPEQYMDILRMNNRPTGNANDVQPAPVPSGAAMAQGQQQSAVQSGAAMAAGQQQSPDQVQAAMEAAQAPAVDPLAQQMAMAAGQTQTADQIGAAMAAAQGAGGGGFVDPYADAAAAQQARQRELLSGLQGGTPAQVDMMYNQAPAYQQQQLLNMGYQSQLPTNTGLQLGSSQLGASGATVAQEAMRDAQRAALSSVGGYRNSYADAAAAQQPRMPFQPSYADAAAQQPDDGLRTFTGAGERIAGPVGGQTGPDTLQQRLEQAYLERIGADDPILASQLADQQLRQQEQERGLIEQLSRYGVLRGGGDTAAVLSRLAEGNERNRLALEASAAGRRQQDLRDALAFDQTRSQMGLAERGQTLQESLGQQSVLNQELSRAAQRAGLTGQFEGQDTLSAQLQRQQMGLASDANQRAERAQQAELLGRVAFDPRTQMALAQAGQDTLAGRELALREQLAQSGDLRAQQAAESALFGRVITGTDAPITTLEGQRTLSDLDAAQLAREATEAGLTGQFRGIDTAAERALQSQLSSADLARQLNEAAVTGQYGGQATLQFQELQSALQSQDLARRLQEAGVTGSYNGQQTLQAQALEQEMQNQALNRALSRAGATGMFREEGDTGPGVQTLENQLRTAALTGQLGGQNTLAGRQAEMDTIGAVLASLDPNLGGRADALAEALVSRYAQETGQQGIADALGQQVQDARNLTDQQFREIMENQTISQAQKDEIIRSRPDLYDRYTAPTAENIDRFRSLMENNSVPDSIKQEYRNRFPELAAAYDERRG